MAWNAGSAFTIWTAALKYEQRPLIAAATSAATDLGAIDWLADLSPVHFVNLELDDRDDHVVSDNFYWCGPPIIRTISRRWKPFRRHRSMPGSSATTMTNTAGWMCNCPIRPGRGPHGPHSAAKAKLERADPARVLQRQLRQPASGRKPLDLRRGGESRVSVMTSR